jgi:hypothetical protein
MRRDPVSDGDQARSGMLEQPIFLIDGPRRVRGLVREHPWAVLVSPTPGPGSSGSSDH